MRIFVGVLLAALGALLCSVELLSENRDWPTVIIGMLLLLVGVGCLWTRGAGLLRR